VGGFLAIRPAAHPTISTIASPSGLWRFSLIEREPLSHLHDQHVGYYSGDNGTAANRPQLVVTYQ